MAEEPQYIVQKIMLRYPGGDRGHTDKDIVGLVAVHRQFIPGYMCRGAATAEGGSFCSFSSDLICPTGWRNCLP